MAVTITQKDVEKARDYLPAETKEALTRLMAKLCTRIVENDASTAEAPLPPYRVEDRLRRLQCLNGCCVRFTSAGVLKNSSSWCRRRTAAARKSGRSKA